MGSSLLCESLVSFSLLCFVQLRGFVELFRLVFLITLDSPLLTSETCFFLFDVVVSAGCLANWREKAETCRCLAINNTNFDRVGTRNGPEENMDSES